MWRRDVTFVIPRLESVPMAGSYLAKISSEYITRMKGRPPPPPPLSRPNWLVEQGAQQGSATIRHWADIVKQLRKILLNWRGEGVAGVCQADLTFVITCLPVSPHLALIVSKKQNIKPVNWYIISSQAVVHQQVPITWQCGGVLSALHLSPPGLLVSAQFSIFTLRSPVATVYPTFPGPDGR